MIGNLNERKKGTKLADVSFAERTTNIRVPAGFTLLELLLVLVILTALATVAVQTIEPQVNQARFESTQTTLDNVRDAIIGPENQRAADGSVAISGFIADVGRPPLLLQELWSNPNLIPAFTHTQPAGDSEVTSSAGWNGPYLQLPVGATSLTDAWGTSFDLYMHDGTTSTSNDEIHIIRSRGRDGVSLSGTGYDLDTDLAVKATASAVTANLTSTEVNHIEQTLTVYVYYQSTSQNPDSAQGTNVIVRIYGPELGLVQTIAQLTDTADATPMSFTFSNVPIGPKIIRAYQTSSSPGDEDSISTSVKSTPQRVVVSRHTQSIQLILN